MALKICTRSWIQRQVGDVMSLILLLIVLCDLLLAQDSINERDIIQINSGIAVPFGRSLYISPVTDLKINVREGDRCRVRVLFNDPLSQRPGRLTPDEFPCKFGPQEVQYSHFGARSPSRDRVRLQLRYDSHDDTIIIPFIIDVEVLFVQLQIVTRNMPLVVEKILGYSNPFDRQTLQFTYDQSFQKCKVTILSKASGLPAYGEIVNAERNGIMKDCEEFLQSDIKYKHTADINSPSRDFIPMVVELTDNEGNVLLNEYFQVMVRIKDGQENTPPQNSFNALYLMEVNQFVMTPITPTILAAEDKETPVEKLIFNITSPLEFGEGVIVSTDDPTIPLHSFYQKDLHDLKIAYKPPASDSNFKRTYRVELEVLDSDGLASDPFVLMIIVNPMNTLAPLPTRNTGIQLFEGQSRRLQSSKNLEVSDEDNLEDVTITLLDGLRHGRLLMNGESIKLFTPADLDAGVVEYHHDGTDTYSDNIIFRMSDGRHDVDFLFPVTVYPEDDEAPVLNVNTGLFINKGDVVEISPFVLSATDVDSDDSSIKFTLETPFSRQSQILLRTEEEPENSETWQFVDGLYEKPVLEWTQDNITSGIVYYRHIGEHNPDVVMDTIHFRIQDNNDPPNVSPLNTFIVKVNPVDDIPPNLYPGIPLQMTVAEFELTEFTKHFLRYTDLDSNDRNIKYTITVPPFDVDTNNPLDAGSIVLTEEPDKIVNTFNQSQINHHKIAYKPPSIELGIVPRIIQFIFSVEDENKNVLPDQRFTIFLQPVDNKPPVITNTGFTVMENGFMVITPQILDATDPDTDLGELTFALTESPEHGSLKYDNQKMANGDTFSRLDIESGEVVYENSGAEMEKDQFKLQVTDGVHRVPLTVRITVRPTDDEAPILNLPPGTVGVHLDVNEDQSVILSPNTFKASDPDTDDLMLTFIVDEPPREGLITVRNRPVNHFTQKQIMDGLVEYRHTGGEIGPNIVRDSFNLTISDTSDGLVVNGNQIQQVTVKVTIHPVDSIPPEIALGSMFLVNEGSKQLITEDNLSATDADTNEDDLTCTIIVQPTSGYLENISPGPGSEKSRAGMPISAFTVGDIKSGFINYVQSIHKATEPVEDRFTFRCSDGVNFTPNEFFPIVINPRNDEIPEIFMREFVVMEGMDLSFDIPILNAIDLDVPQDELIFIVTKGPKHGQIIQQLPSGIHPIKNFTLTQISTASTIVYQHDDTETSNDTFELLLTDGIHNVSKSFMVLIIPVDDETPRLTINNGIEVDIGEMKSINNRVLKAEDLDSYDGNLTFIIRKQPQHGYLVLVNPESGDVLFNITAGMNFTQTDVDENRIKYVHSGREGVRDVFKFDVTDGFNPLIDRHFYITVEGIDMIYPDVINKGVELPEGGKVTLTTDILSTNDLNSPDENLRFTITRAPSKGHLENTDNPGLPISSFTQLDLAGNKIYYVHTSDDEMKMDHFEFEVTDGFNSVFRTFRISLSDVDNKKPIVYFTKLLVKEGGRKLITPFELKIEDKDTPEANLKFTITQIPVHGSLFYNNSHVVNIFTMADISENLISYQQDGSEASSDSFSFVVTDGTHTDFYVFPHVTYTTRTPQMMPIDITPIDNGVPQIVVNKGLSSIGPLAHGGLGVRITNKVLRAEDRDSDNNKLLYTVTQQPSHGYITNTNRGNFSVSNFTQGDVDHMRIYYILKPNVNATSDKFHFKVTDQGDNELINQPFLLNWAWVSFEKELYQVNETHKNLKVNLKRRGYLGETSFVGIVTKDITAKKGEDYHKTFATQVQFNPGQTEASWKIRILEDHEYELSENFDILLEDPVMAALEFPDVAKVTIVDEEDESTVFIPESKYLVEEDIGELLVPVRRTGDLSKEMMVVCSTESDTATGTVPTTVLSYSDYISRTEDHTSLIRFDRNEDLQFCRVLIIDDSLYEDEEKFYVQLSMPMGGKVGTHNQTEVIIAPDEDDAPAFYFGAPEYHVDETDGFIEVKVWRTGTDLSKTGSVTVRSKPSNPQSAEAGHDYVGLGKNLDFAPGVTMQTVRVIILDDLGQPSLEGLETFDLVLRMPVNAILGEPSTAVVTINDSISDLPKVQFKDPAYMGFENDGQVSAFVIRSGDVSHLSTVRCYTRQGTAQVMMDFDERPFTNDSLLTFLPGEVEKVCSVILMNDDIHEEDEEFKLVLGHAQSETAKGALIGPLNETKVTIKDIGDKSVIKFEKTQFTIKEPREAGDVNVVKVGVVRLGDLSQTSIVRVHTKDGSAKAGSDYGGLSKELIFKPNVSRIVVEVEILHDDDRENREAFTIHLRPDVNMIADVQMDKAIIYIEEIGKVADVTFPSRPIVVSLADYDQAENADANPTQGYPVVCITPCNPKFPDYSKTGALCTKEGINDSLTEFRWRVSAPSGLDGVTNELKDVESNTFFTKTKYITLDSIYFGPGSRVQCMARAVNLEGDPGLELGSPIIIISVTEGICAPRLQGSVGAEPFTAKMRYTGPDDSDHPNMIRLSITIPHRDGMLPVISTRQLSNFELSLSPDGSRVGNHRCSNLLDHDEIRTKHGFITEAPKNPNIIGEVEPYQYSAEMRSEPTLRFYRNLDLEACMWEFISFYDMSELVNDCGGIIGTDGQVLNLTQSYVSVRVPLYVSYISHSPVASGGWQHYDLTSQLRLTFVYDTAILWEHGIGAPEESQLQGYLYPTSMRIRDDGRLVVNFRTEPRFRGQFVSNHPGTNLASMVMSPDQGELTFTLELIRTEPTYAQPEQYWEFVSDYAVRDYSGTYAIKLIPCTVTEDVAYSLPVVCNPREPITFDLQIRFQQVSDPVPTEFSLNTQFHLMRKKELWLSDGSMGFGEESDAAFTPGDTIYGRVMVDPVQNLGDSFAMTIEKCFLCTGVDGYIPKYDPASNEFGCVADSSNLLHNFKILDKGAPNTVVESFRSIPFNARLAIDEPSALLLVSQPGSDGFQMDSNPLFQVSHGRQWFLHCIYTVRSKESVARGIGKRSIEHNIFSEIPDDDDSEDDYYKDAINQNFENDNYDNNDHYRNPRDVLDVEGIGRNGRGTNIHRIKMSYASRTNADETEEGGRYEIGSSSNEVQIPIIPIVVSLCVILVVVIIVVVAFTIRKKKFTPSPPPSNTVTIVTSNGMSKVVNPYYHTNDNTEV